MSVTEVLALYREEFERGKTLFDSYDAYYSHLLGEADRSLKFRDTYRNDTHWYGKLEAGQELLNKKVKYFLQTLSLNYSLFLLFLPL